MNKYLDFEVFFVWQKNVVNINKCAHSEFSEQLLRTD